MRNAHYWKLAGAKSAPSNIICFDTETWHGDRAITAGGEFHTLRLGCAIAYRLEGGKRTRVKRLTFKVATDFFQLLTGRIDKRRPLWVFAHNTSYDLGIVNGWKWITGSGVEVEKAAVSGTLLYIVCRYKGCKVIFCDTLNYYRCSLSSLGKAVGILKGEMPNQDAPDSEWEAYCRQDVEVTAAAVDHLINFNRKEQLGPWQPSIAGLAFSGYRAAFMREKILVHAYRPALEIERGSYYGGLVDTPYVGSIRDTPIYELDVCSMYPAVCQLDLPTVIKDYSYRIGPIRLGELLKQYMVFADVTIETKDEPYPVRLKAGTFHATGRFQTCLADPELRLAVERGHVKWIHRASWYRKAPIFAEYMRYFARKKIEYDKQDNDAFRTLCKYYMNNLYGKTGQLTPKWCEWGPDAFAALEEKWGLAPGYLQERYPKPPDLYQLEEPYRIPEIPEPLECRDYYGVVEVKCGEHESRDSCPAIAAAVTSYARVLLRSFQRTAGQGNWFYCDTDSIWVNETGYTKLVASGSVRASELGYLDLKKRHDRLTVYGPKDYETENVKRLKGIRPSAKPDGEGGWIQLHFPGATAQIKEGREGGVYVEHVTKHCHRQLTKCVRTADGWTRPLVFPQENPELTKARKRRRER